MKSDEIKNALECCRRFDSCRKCPFSKVKNCREIVSYEALAYIQDLEQENKAMHKLLEEKRNAKAEAIKEFAERLKGNFTEQFCGQKYDLIHGWIDNLVKEMVGENNGRQ